MSDPMVLDHSLLTFEKTEVINILSILQMVMMHSGYLTSLQYSLRNNDWKEEPQRTISTQKSCRICTKGWKNILYYDRF
jgi:hypothetical protein